MDVHWLAVYVEGIKVSDEFSKSCVLLVAEHCKTAASRKYKVKAEDKLRVDLSSSVFAPK